MQALESRDDDLGVEQAHSDHADRFWARVDRRSEPGACWRWQGALNAGGRGRFTVCGKTMYAYRWALLFSGVDVAGGTPVRHLCGEPSCCRPSHLTTDGGQRENNLDAVEHGRHRTAKLDAARVRELRRRYAADQPELRRLAAEFGVSASAISAALTGRTWPRAGGPLKPSRKRER